MFILPIALGNCIACNDHVALVHPDIDQETEEIISDVLGVEVFRQVCVCHLFNSYFEDKFSQFLAICLSGATVDSQTWVESCTRLLVSPSWKNSLRSYRFVSLSLMTITHARLDSVSRWYCQ